MTLPFAILALITLLGAVGAMMMRRLVYCALCLVVTFVGLAGLYLQLHAQFVGLIQLLVYVGAVAILIVFAILLTRSSDAAGPRTSGLGWIGLGVAALAFATLAAAILGPDSGFGNRTIPMETEVTVKAVGRELMEIYVVPLEVIGLLLTAAMIGAVIVALKDPASDRASEGEDR